MQRARRSILPHPFLTVLLIIVCSCVMSGFVGKLLILDASFDTPLMWLTWAVILGSSLLAVVGFSRAGSVLFWKSHQVACELADETLPEDAQGALEPSDPEGHIPVLELVSIGGLLALLVAHTVFAGPVTRYMGETTAQLFTPEPYIRAVLDVPGKDLSKDPHATEAGHDAATDDAHGAVASEGGH